MFYKGSQISSGDGDGDGIHDVEMEKLQMSRKRRGSWGGKKVLLPLPFVCVFTFILLRFGA